MIRSAISFSALAAIVVMILFMLREVPTDARSSSHAGTKHQQLAPPPSDGANESTEQLVTPPAAPAETPVVSAEKPAVSADTPEVSAETPAPREKVATKPTDDASAPAAAASLDKTPFDLALLELLLQARAHDESDPARRAEIEREIEQVRRERQSILIP